jgi:hypothetical protein
LTKVTKMQSGAVITASRRAASTELPTASVDKEHPAAALRFKALEGLRHCR